MTFEEYRQRFNRETEIKGTHGWIQWKGTDVCMDVHCGCGQLFHIDAEFAYFVRCPDCHTIYGVGECVPLVKLTEEEFQGMDTTQLIEPGVNG